MSGERSVQWDIAPALADGYIWVRMAHWGPLCIVLIDQPGDWVHAPTLCRSARERRSTGFASTVPTGGSACRACVEQYQRLEVAG